VYAAQEYSIATMLILISPAKKLATATAAVTDHYTQAELLDDASQLQAILKEKNSFDIAELMKLSRPLADLNMQRFQAWQRPFNRENAREAIYSFRGDVYQAMDADTLDSSEIQFAQAHLRILSGLYGLLRPLDLIQPYRLEMGTRIANTRGRNLYAFWGSIITEAINRVLAAQGDDLLINLASGEYFKAVQPAAIKGRVITPVFKEQRNGVYKIIGFNAKKARGMMCRYIIQNRLHEAGQLKQFELAGYRFSEAMSTSDQWLFIR